LYGNWKVQAEQIELEELETQERAQEKVIEYQKSLHKQVEEIQQKKKDDYQQFLKEKAMVDEIVKNIILENEKYGIRLCFGHAKRGPSQGSSLAPGETARNQGIC